ncbi:conserved hypothetical protein [Ricinus communis]|uniref:Uncharacterized protein n=1 Tax=Ricinus communis TaxID=3988 RepID=B9T1D9_RICCO|nr:conserved hypothetical protein [Ricinus communis]
MEKAYHLKQAPGKWSLPILSYVVGKAFDSTNSSAPRAMFKGWSSGYAPTFKIIELDSLRWSTWDQQNSKTAEPTCFTPGEQHLGQRPQQFGRYREKRFFLDQNGGYYKKNRLFFKSPCEDKNLERLSILSITLFLLVGSKSARRGRDQAEPLGE